MHITNSKRKSDADMSNRHPWKFGCNVESLKTHFQLETRRIPLGTEVKLEKGHESDNRNLNTFHQTYTLKIVLLSCRRNFQWL